MDKWESFGIRDFAFYADFLLWRYRQNFIPLLERVALVGEGDLGTLCGGGLGDAPGDRTVVRHPHDEALLASH